MAKQMISIPTSLNDNISSLARKLKAKGFLEENEEKDRAGDRVDDDITMDITFTNLDLMDQKKQVHMAEELQKSYEVAETMQELERKTEE